MAIDDHKIELKCKYTRRPITPAAAPGGQGRTTQLCYNLHCFMSNYQVMYMPLPERGILYPGFLDVSLEMPALSWGWKVGEAFCPQNTVHQIYCAVPCTPGRKGEKVEVGA